MNKKIINAHKKRKRTLEAQLIVDYIRQMLEKGSKGTNIDILEFGAGDGFQIPYLQSLGNVVASDINISESLYTNHASDIVKCNICETPFKANSFDLVFSNQVLEHIEDLRSAFHELKRIGKVDCVYAFSVPTVWWLLLTIPTHYLIALTRVITKFRCCVASEKNILSDTSDTTEESLLDVDREPKPNNYIITKIVKFIQPAGHGCWGRRRFGFFQCWWHFRIGEWKALFQKNSFKVLQIEPLLLYSVSEWPVIPTMRLPAKYGLYSSVLFIMKRC